MIGFDSIGQSAIGELSGDGNDLVIFVPAGPVIAVTNTAPAIGGGCSVAPSSVAVAVTAAACLVSISATIAVDASAVLATAPVPVIVAEAATVLPSAVAVSATVVVPLISAGSRIMPPNANVSAVPSAPMVSAGVTVLPGAVSVAVATSVPDILGGNYIDARNTITMNTPYGEIASASIGQFAIGEGEPSTRIVLQSPFVVVMSAPASIFAGKTIKPAGASISVTPFRPEIDSRGRKLRVFAIAS